MCCKDFRLPEPDEIFDMNNESNEENILFCKQMFNNFYSQLNDDQKTIFTQILSNKHKIHFIDGPPGGSGKTFLYKTLIYYFLSIEKKLCQWLG